MYASPQYGAVQPQLAWFATWLVLVLLVVVRSQTLDRNSQGALAAAGATMLALVYLGLLPGFFIAIRQWYAAWVVAAIVLITKSCDIGAYFTGRALGRHKLIPWLSPGKTWEGLVGGTALATLLAVGLAAITQQTDWVTVQRVIDGEPTRLVQRYHLGWAAVLGAALAVIGHAGDLSMSLFKRDAGLKDSGRLIPGMGGILDVLDSTLLAGPVAYWLLLLAEIQPS